MASKSKHYIKLVSFRKRLLIKRWGSPGELKGAHELFRLAERNDNALAALSVKVARLLPDANFMGSLPDKDTSNFKERLVEALCRQKQCINANKALRILSPDVQIQTEEGLSGSTLIMIGDDSDSIDSIKVCKEKLAWLNFKQVHFYLFSEE